MGVYIKGMKMQKKCSWCMFSRFATKWYCNITLNCINDYIDSSPKDCPITDVPEPHGRLIDADALMNVYIKNEFCSDMGDAMEVLDNFPTVIEAEGNE